MPQRKDIDWSSVDWSRGTYRLAEELGVHPSKVSRARGRYAPETKHRWTAPRRRAGRVGVNWSAVDWALKSGQLAKALGRKRNYVSTMRKKYAPHTLSHGRAKGPEVNWAKVDWRKRDADLARNLGYSPTHVGKMRRRYAGS